MSGEWWRTGWQEDAFARVQGFVRSSPAWYQRLSPSDVAEDAYLLTLASTLFLRDGGGAARKGTGKTKRSQPEVTGPPPMAAPPPFSYEAAIADKEQGTALFGRAVSGEFGAFHRGAAKAAGSVEDWRSALRALHSAGCLRRELAFDTMLYPHREATVQEDLKECGRAVLMKSLRAFKIGFGLWGRWEAT